jgi:hypothetical protein
MDKKAFSGLRNKLSVYRDNGKSVPQELKEEVRKVVAETEKEVTRDQAAKALNVPLPTFYSWLSPTKKRTFTRKKVTETKQVVSAPTVTTRTQDGNFLIKVCNPSGSTTLFEANVSKKVVTSFLTDYFSRV